jgi:predicted amidohydrolase YtcJ
VGVEQRITPSEALALYTTGSAVATGEAGSKGRLAPGYLADFVVLADDPLTCDPDRIGDIGVRATYVGGVRVWHAAG